MQLPSFAQPIFPGQTPYEPSVHLGYKRCCHGRHAYRSTFCRLANRVVRALGQLRREVVDLRQEVIDLRCENAGLRQEVADLRRENAELWQQVGY